MMILLREIGALDPRAAFIAALGFVLPMTLSAEAIAQERPAQFAQNDSTEKLDTLKQRDEALKSARDQQRKSADSEAALKREIEQIGADRRKLNQDLIETATRLRGAESQDRVNARAARSRSTTMNAAFANRLTVAAL